MAPHANDDASESPLSGPAEGANLTTISIGKLMSGDEATKTELLRTCKDLGFFYLDVRDHPSGQMVSQIEQIKSTALQFYDQPQQEKDKWEVNKDHVAGEEIVLG